jgi:hypothetical protein
MSGPVIAAPAVELPERLDRPTRFGPFPSAADALKFLAIGAFGAVLSLRFGPLLWTPFLGGGLLLALSRREGGSADERAWEFVRWRWRRALPLPRRSRAAREDPQGIARSSGGDLVVGIEAGGVPIAHLPSAEAQRLFEAYRQFLRGLSVAAVISVGRARLRAPPFLPEELPGLSAAEAGARRGYGDLVRMLARRRSRRRTRVLLFGLRSAGAGASLVRERRALELFLAGIEVPFRRLSAAEVRAQLGRPGGRGA